MKLNLIVAPVFGTNTCVLAAENGDAIIVDPGAGVQSQVLKLVENYQLKVLAVAATHGHADHTWDGGPLCQHFGVPFLINDADKYRLADPLGTLQVKDTRPDQSVAVAIAQAVKALDVGEYQQPSPIVTFGPAGLGGDDAAASDGQITLSDASEYGAKLKVGSIELDLIFAPGHTEGSTLYQTADFILSGDVLFTGSIGRTDLPGGDLGTMTQTLRRLAATIDPKLRVIPGHGPATVMSDELATNPYLKAALAH